MAIEGLVRQLSGARVRRRLISAAIIILLLRTFGHSVVWAQAPSVPAAAVTAAAAAELDSSSVRLFVGRSTVLEVGTAIARVSLTSADVADALVTSPTQVLIHGKTPGTISMFVWDRTGGLRRFEVAVQRDLATLSNQLRDLFPTEQISAESNGKNIVLTGTVSSKEVIDRAINLAAGYVDKREEVTTLLQLLPTGASNQVLLRVRFAEVSRNSLSEIGAALAANGFKDGRWFGRTTTQQFPAPEWDNDGKFVFSDFLNLFLFDSKNELAAVVKALQSKGLFQSLAEPNLIAESGKEASFLAGGEIPIPIAQGTGAGLALSVMFKEFGVRLNFTPTVNGNRINLKVRPEVSTLDFANAIVLNGFRIPALSTRRTETELELENGQTFAIAGLMNNTVRSTMSKIPGIGDIPILGLLFQSKAAQRDQTELVVMITPQILPNNSPGVTPNLPRTPEKFLAPLEEKKSQPAPPPAFSGIGPAAAPGSDRAAVAPAPRPQAPAIQSSSAAAAVAALTPSAPRAMELPAPRANTTPDVAVTPAVPAVVANAPANLSAANPAMEPVADPSVVNFPAAAASSVGVPAVPDETRPLTKDEKKLADRARREEQQRAKVMAEQAKRDAKDQKRIDATNREKAEREAEALTKAHAAGEAQSRKEAARQADADQRAQLEARKQAERDRVHQKDVDDAAVRLRQAEEAYYAQVAKQTNQ